MTHCAQVLCVQSGSRFCQELDRWALQVAAMGLLRLECGRNSLRSGTQMDWHCMETLGFTRGITLPQGCVPGRI